MQGKIEGLTGCRVREGRREGRERERKGKRGGPGVRERERERERVCNNALHTPIFTEKDIIYIVHE